MWMIFLEETTPLKRLLNYTKKLRIGFAEGYFNLRKWRTNDANLRKLLSETAQNDINQKRFQELYRTKLMTLQSLSLKKLLNYRKPYQ